VVVCEQVKVPVAGEYGVWGRPWEKLNEPRSYQKETQAESFRLWVPGGWVVMRIVYRYGAGVALSLLFLEDPEHTWKLDSLFVIP
jgi:hypothetical protein